MLARLVSKKSCRPPPTPGRDREAERRLTMRHSPEKLDRLTEAERRIKAEGYWIYNLGALNRVYLALKGLRPMCISGMSWTDDYRMELLRIADEALADAEGMKKAEASNDHNI